MQRHEAGKRVALLFCREGHLSNRTHKIQMKSPTLDDPSLISPNASNIWSVQILFGRSYRKHKSAALETSKGLPPGTALHSRDWGCTCIAPGSFQHVLMTNSRISLKTKCIIKKIQYSAIRSLILIVN